MAKLLANPGLVNLYQGTAPGHFPSRNLTRTFMSEKIYNSPLLAQDSPLDKHSREVIQQVYDAEWARLQELPTDDPLDLKRRRRVESTWDEMMGQEAAIRETLTTEQKTI